MRLDEIPRIRMADLPTSLDEAPRLAKEIGLKQLLVKRDDNTGLAMGGNKARKLEFLMAEAQALGADIVLTCGGAQSNHARMTAAAARKLGMDATLFLIDPMPKDFGGNLLLDTLVGAEIRFLPNADYRELENAMEAEEARLRSIGRTPYLVPMGGSTKIGAMGYVNAVRELAGQLQGLGIQNPDIVVALGSGGTLAGLVLGCYLFLPEARLFGISVSRETAKIMTRVVRIANEAAQLVGIAHEPNLDSMQIYDEYVGEAYAVPTQAGKEAILLTARTEGIILDPVYTGKAMSGLIDLAHKGVIGVDRPVLFWHTGGAAGLFAFESLFHEDAVNLSREI